MHRLFFQFKQRDAIGKTTQIGTTTVDADSKKRNTLTTSTCLHLLRWITTLAIAECFENVRILFYDKWFYSERKRNASVENRNILYKALAFDFNFDCVVEIRSQSDTIGLFWLKRQDT